VKAIILSLFLLVSVANSDELNLKLGSYVNHKASTYEETDGTYRKYNEGFGNKLVGLDYLCEVSDNHYIGLTYMQFTNSYYDDTVMIGGIYKYSFEEWLGINPNIKVSLVYQEGYGRVTPALPIMMVPSIGVEYYGVTTDLTVVPDSSAILVFGYDFSIK